MVDGLLFEMKKEKVTSRCEIDRLRNDRDEVLKRLEKYRREKQSDIDLFKRIKYDQVYKDHEQGKEPRYPLEDEAFGDEVGSNDYEKDEAEEQRRKSRVLR